MRTITLKWGDKMEDLYKQYVNVIKDNLLLDKDDWYFKSHPRYRDILEHVSPAQGGQFLATIKEKYSNFYTTHKEYLIELCTQNDLYGKTFKAKHADFAECSPSNLRYILHSLLVLEYMKSISLNNINVVEIGGGYGGLAFFINKMAPLVNVEINSYVVFDLHEAGLLTKKYLETLGVEAQTSQLDSCSLLSKNSFLISNYALSEISPAIQKKYTEQILDPYISHGFLTWNGGRNVFTKEFYDKFISSKSIYKVAEYPQTNLRDYSNSYVYFRPRSGMQFINKTQNGD